MRLEAGQACLDTTSNARAEQEKVKFLLLEKHSYGHEKASHSLEGNICKPSTGQKTRIQNGPLKPREPNT